MGHKAHQYHLAPEVP